MCESKELQLQLSEFISSAIASDIQSGLLERILCYQSGSLKTLKIGWTEEQDRGDVLEISFPQNFPKLRVLSLKLANNQRYQPICFEEKFPSLKELCVKVKETGNRGRIYFWEDLIQVKFMHFKTQVIQLMTLFFGHAAETGTIVHKKSSFIVETRADWSAVAFPRKPLRPNDDISKRPIPHAWPTLEKNFDSTVVNLATTQGYLNC